MCPKVTGVYKTEIRERIIQAAIENFAQTGFDRTKMDDIAKTLDLSKGTIYLYFKSKEELFVAICEHYLKALKERLSTLFTRKEDLALDAEHFYENFRRIEQGNEKVMLEMMVESSRNPRLKRTMYEHRLKIQEAVAEYLNRQIERGFFRKEIDVSGLASALVAMYDGLTLSKSLGVSEVANKKAWAAMVRAAIAGVS